MPTYEYECKSCAHKFEQWQAMSEAPLKECPQCHGEIRRVVSGGSGFILKGAGQGRVGKTGASCSLETSGQTCCGRSERCGKPSCGGK